MTLANALTAARALLVIPVIGLIATGDASLALLIFVIAAGRRAGENTTDTHRSDSLLATRNSLACPRSETGPGSAN